MLQHYCCKLVDLAGSPWKVLPPGVHPAALSEIEGTFASNNRRREQFAGLLARASSLLQAGCRMIYVDGSYVTAKPRPGDYDACWDPSGVDSAQLDPVFTDFSNHRQAQRAKFKGEYFPSTGRNLPNQPFLDFFQVDRFTGGRKGILAVQLNNDPMLVRSNP